MLYIGYIVLYSKVYCCIYNSAIRSGLLAKSDAADAVLIVFADYIRLMRRLQKAYCGSTSSLLW